MAPNSMSEAGPSGCVVKTKKIEGKNNPNYGKVMKFWLWNFLKKKIWLWLIIDVLSLNGLSELRWKRTNKWTVNRWSLTLFADQILIKALYAICIDIKRRWIKSSAKSFEIWGFCGFRQKLRKIFLAHTKQSKERTKQVQSANRSDETEANDNKSISNYGH